MSRSLIFALCLLAFPALLDGDVLVVPARTCQSLLVDNVRLAGFSAGYHEVGLAEFDVPPGHYAAASFELSLSGARAVAPGPVPSESLKLLLEEMPSQEPAASADFFHLSRSGPFLGELDVAASPLPQTLTTTLLGQQLLPELDHGGRLVLAGLGFVNPDQPNPLQWTGGGTPALRLQRRAEEQAVPEPAGTAALVLALSVLVRRGRASGAG